MVKYADVDPPVAHRAHRENQECSRNAAIAFDLGVQLVTSVVCCSRSLDRLKDCPRQLLGYALADGAAGTNVGPLTVSIATSSVGRCFGVVNAVTCGCEAARIVGMRRWGPVDEHPSAVIDRADRAVAVVKRSSCETRAVVDGNLGDQRSAARSQFGVCGIAVVSCRTSAWWPGGGGHDEQGQRYGAGDRVCIRNPGAACGVRGSCAVPR